MFVSRITAKENIYNNLNVDRAITLFNNIGNRKPIFSKLHQNLNTPAKSFHDKDNIQI